VKEGKIERGRKGNRKGREERQGKHRDGRREWKVKRKGEGKRRLERERR
jgi:hypothetical protein